MMFCQVLSCSVCCLVVTGNLSDEHWLHWLGFCVAFCWVCLFCEFVTVCVFFGFCGLYSCQESTLPKETSTPSGMQWPGSALPSAEALSASSACVHAILLMIIDAC